MSSETASLWVGCPQCGARLAVRRQDAGQQGRCRSCRHVFVIAAVQDAPPAPSKASHASTAPTSSASPPTASFGETRQRPAIHTFSCSLCQTRITVPTSQVGRRVACPDCGRKNVIPPPPPPTAPNIPAAMAGPQYELWGVDEGPLPARQTARAPQLHPTHCLLCHTLMYARDEQVGKKLKCPDCGSLTPVKATAPKKPTQSVMVADGQEYQLAPHAPAAATTLPALSAMQSLGAPAVGEIALTSHGQTDAVTAAMAARKLEVLEPPKPRPQRPKNPLLQGVWRMMATQEIVARWVLLSLVLGFIVQCASDALLGPAGGLAGFMGIALMVFAAVGSLFWLAMTAPLLHSIVAESGDGNDALLEPPPVISLEIFGPAAAVLTATTGAGLAALGASTLAGRLTCPVEVRIAVAVAAVATIYPFALLSAMLEGTPLGILSPRLAANAFRRPHLWLLFYLEVFAIWAAVGAAAWFLAPTASRESLAPLIWGTVPLAVAALLLTMRLLGRLGWWIGENV